MSFFEELKRRNVFRVGIAYGVASWLILQVADILLEAFDVPAWSMRLIVVVLLIGFPLAVFFAWAFELTPEGIKKESEVDRSQSIAPKTGRKLDFAIIFVLVLALGYFAYDKFILRTGESADQTVVVEESAVAEELVNALPTDKSIAVLPFENRSAREEDEFFTSGIHEDVLMQLASISSLRVISRTSMAQFENTDKSIREIAELLNVATVLEGGVQRAGNQVRVNLQLIDAATDAPLWAGSFDREMTASNVFAIQSEIASAVTDAMRATLTPEEVERIADVPTENMEALEEFFKGRAEIDTRTLPAIESARMRFQHARELDPGFAMAWAGEAQAILLLSDSASSYGDLPTAEVLALSRPLLEKAYELAPDEPMVLAVLGLMERNADNSELANDYYDRSLAIDPNNGEVMNWKRMNLFALGKPAEAAELARRMVEVDPMSMITLFNGIATISRLGDGSPELVEELLQRMNEIDPAKTFDTRALVAESNSHLPGAARNYYLSIELSPGASSTRASLGDLLARLGLYAEALIVDAKANEYVPVYQMNWAENVRLAEQDLEKSPDSLESNTRLIDALYLAGEEEAALDRFAELWEQHGGDSALVGFTSMLMAEAAFRSERPVEMRTYRDATALRVQAMIEAGFTSWFRYYSEAYLAALDRRDKDVLTAMTSAIDRGMRWDGWLITPVFSHLAGDLSFQSQLARMQELASTERTEILNMLCGPEPILTSLEPATETCQMWNEQNTRPAGAPT